MVVPQLGWSSLAHGVHRSAVSDGSTVRASLLFRRESDANCFALQVLARSKTTTNRLSSHRTRLVRSRGSRLCRSSSCLLW